MAAGGRVVGANRGRARQPRYLARKVRMAFLANLIATGPKTLGGSAANNSTTYMVIDFAIASPATR